MEALFIKTGQFIDGTGAAPIANAVVRVERGRIAGIHRPNETPSDIPPESLIDASGLTVLPGLINAHTHLVTQRLAAYKEVWEWPEMLQVLRAADKGQSELSLGITSVRDLGAKGALNIVLKYAIESGLIKGPRLVVCGQLICMTGGHGNYMGKEVDGPDEMRAAVREMFKRGADFIKLVASGGMGVSGGHPVFTWQTQVIADTVQQELTEQEMRVAVEEAHKIGRRVSAHAYGMPAIGAALAAGVDAIEHGIMLDEAAANYMVEHDVSLVPTLTGIQQIVDFGPARGVPQHIIDRARGYVDAHRQSVAVAKAAGVRIAAGSDSSGELRLELEHLVAAGLSNAEALSAATKSAAEVLARDDVGTLEVGKWADVLAVEGDPLQNISDVRNPRLVLKGGEIVFQALNS